MKKNNKKIIMVTGGKGGCGKSTLFFVLAEKYKDAVILDMDDSSQSTLQNLAYRNPKKVSFLNENKTIDRGFLNDFFERIVTHEKKLFFCDLGASISEQLPSYITDITPKEFSNLLSQIEIDLELVCIVGGADIFKATMMYLDELVIAIENKLSLTVANNRYFQLEEIQKQQIDDYVRENQLKLVEFNISEDRNSSTQNRIKEVLKSGKGIEAASIFSKPYFLIAIENLKI